jgi:hypothetical protein
MKELKKSVILLSLLGAVTLGAGITVAAQTMNRVVEATVRYDMNIRLDGETLVLRNAAGDVVQPIMIDGTTYLPLRALGEILGLDVNWEGATQTVSLYSRRDRALWLADHASVIDGNRLSIVRGVGNIHQPAGHTFDSAVTLGFGSIGADGVIELDTRYDSLNLTGIMFHRENNQRDAVIEFSIVNADTGTTLFTRPLQANVLHTDISFNLYGATRLRVSVPLSGELARYGAAGNQGNTIYLFNPILVN